MGLRLKLTFALLAKNLTVEAFVHLDLSSLHRYMKAIGVIKTCDFKTNAHNARALEVMIPCHNNAATCNIKLKNYKDARLLAENVSDRFTLLTGAQI